MQIIYNFLSNNECRGFIEQTEKNINKNTHPEAENYEKLPDYYMYDDPRLAQKIWEKLKPVAVLPNYTDQYGDIFIPDTINKGFTILRYYPGYKMRKHIDNPYSLCAHNYYPATFMVYLNDVPVNHGGSTCFYSPYIQVQPETGKGVLFMGQDLEHEVLELKHGMRYS